MDWSHPKPRLEYLSSELLVNSVFVQEEGKFILDPANPIPMRQPRGRPVQDE
jgi:hypothetical protein